MASATGPASLFLEVTRIFPAPRQRVWQAWAQPEQLARWMCRTGPDGEVRVLHLDLRVGGGFAVEAQGPTGPLYHLDCTYREIKPHERFVFTWKWQHDEEQSLVTVTLADHASGGTEMRVLHEKLVTEQSRKGHLFGWNACLDALATIL